MTCSYHLGAAVVWDSEVHSALLEGREEAEDFLNEWELMAETASPIVSLKTEIKVTPIVEDINKSGKSKKVVKNKAPVVMFERNREKFVKMGMQRGGRNSNSTTAVPEIYKFVATEDKVKENLKEVAIDRREEKEAAEVEGMASRSTRSRGGARSDTERDTEYCPVPVSVPVPLPSPTTSSPSVLLLQSLPPPILFSIPVLSESANSHNSIVPAPCSLSALLPESISESILDPMSVDCETVEVSLTLRRGVRTASLAVHNNVSSDMNLNVRSRDNRLSRDTGEGCGVDRYNRSKSDNTESEKDTNTVEDLKALSLPMLSPSALMDLNTQWVNYSLLRLVDLFLSLGDFEAFADLITRMFNIRS